MRKLYIISIAVLAIGVIVKSAAVAAAETSISSEVNSSGTKVSVSSDVSSSNTSSVSMNQTIRYRSNGDMVVHTYKEENGKVIEDSTKTISPAEGNSGAQSKAIKKPRSTALLDREALKAEIENRAAKGIQKGEELLEKDLEVEMEEMESTIESEVDEAKEEIDEEMEQAEQEIQDEIQEMEEETEGRDESWWERLREWVRERFENLRD